MHSSKGIQLLKTKIRMIYKICKKKKKYQVWNILQIIIKTINISNHKHYMVIIVVDYKLRNMIKIMIIIIIMNLNSIVQWNLRIQRNLNHL